MKQHEFVKTTDGSGRDICIDCGSLKDGVIGEECKPREGLLTHVSHGGVEVFSLWKHFGYEAESVPAQDLSPVTVLDEQVRKYAGEQGLKLADDYDQQLAAIQNYFNEPIGIEK